jgi:predicted CoA-binding protein
MHTLVLGATTNPNRIAFQAIYRLVAKGYSVSAVGIREGVVAGIPIQQGTPDLEDVHTITLYLNPTRQEPYYDYILGLKPQRIIFNPGTENIHLMQLAKDAGIATEMACTLVMLATEEYAN